MKRVLAFAALLRPCRPPPFAATDPRTVPTKLDPAWQAKTRDVFKQAIEIPTRPQPRRNAAHGEAARRPVPRGRHSRSRHPHHAVRGAARRQDGGADRPLALAARDQEADADPRPHGRGRGQARGLEIRPVRVPRGRRLFPRPRHQRHEERRRRDDHGRGQADVRKGSSPTATSSSSTAATRRRAASARRSARPSGAT